MPDPFYPSVDFSFIEEKPGQPLYSGLIILRKMMDICKPETIIEVATSNKNLTRSPSGLVTTTTFAS
jgi:hypothetical protein